MKTGWIVALAVLLLGFSGPGYALEHRLCFAAAAHRFQIDEVLLMAIAQWESRMQASIVHQNKDGSADYGLMQINSSHLPWLQKAGFKKSDLFDPCTNIHIGAFILHDCIRRHGKTWRAVGAYNAGSRKDREKARLKYVLRVQQTYEKIKRDKKA